MTNVTDFEFDPDTDFDPTEGEEVAEVETPVKPAKRVKHPIPDGWDTPSEFSIFLNYNELSSIDAQGLYALAANREGFPSKRHTDDRVIINRAEGIEWIAEREGELKERDAKRAERLANRQAAQMRSVTKATASLAKEARKALAKGN